MREQARNQDCRNEPNPYATREDFIKVFHEDMNGLYQLSFLLTGNHEKAEKCFVAGIEDCVKENRVFREWARSWAKRIMTENAIRELKPRPILPSSPSATVSSHSERSSSSGGQFDLETLLGLRDFERFVFVMSVLEDYSHHECALLLGCSVLEIRQGRLHALEELASSGQVVSFAPSGYCEGSVGTCANKIQEVDAARA
jgi:DNA-directed RNA polymerase specialized sigma24 family protein